MSFNLLIFLNRYLGNCQFAAMPFGHSPKRIPALLMKAFVLEATFMAQDQKPQFVTVYKKNNRLSSEKS